MKNIINPDPVITDQFLASTIHEVRTPLQTIISTLQLLRETNLNTEQQEYIRQLQFSTDGLLSLANDILVFSKIRSGKFNIEKIPTNIIKVIEQTVNLICIAVLNRGLEIVTDIGYTIMPSILTDPMRIQQVLLNLINNAVKFTHEGYIRVHVTQETDKALLLFKVEDSGIGIPAKKQKSIFKDFYQVDASNTRKYGGTGLGLAISKGMYVLWAEKSA